MDIRMLHVDTELMRVFDSISDNPENWFQWTCIYIKDPDLEIFRIAKELLPEMESKLKTYLKGINGMLFMGGYKDIYVFINGKNKSQCQNLGKNIAELINPKKASDLYIAFYDLRTEKDIFIADIIKKSDMYNAFDSALHYYDHVRKTNEEEKSLFQKNEFPNILLVEDDPTTRWLFRKALKSGGIIITAQNAAEALAVYEEDDPDIVFLDIGLPDGSGHTVLEWITRNDPNSYVVICTGKDDPENRRVALENGAKDYLVKPISPEKLLHHLKCSQGCSE